ncbi:MAG: sigma-54 dependent transcriptional regulator [Nitrospirae bacterium]|nr:sigma-54 dependent transcriptional regulator [Nitrospirota bacterium]MCL5978112.1 sigma-54 dependent transcriptional regulator [Nitrospirota bacterium]
MKMLVIEDELSVRLGISCTLEKAGYKVTAVDNGIDGIRLFEKEHFDVVITDLRLPGADGIEVLKSIKNISTDAGVIIITAFADVKTAVEAMREGAYDYISKPFDPNELLIIIDRFIKHSGLVLENIRLKEEVRDKKEFQCIIGVSSAMQAIFGTIEVVAKTDSSVMIYGESGTGKELVANAIHNLSSRKDKPFIKINCAAIPENLLESELFGHEKGAFTGAVQRRKGKFETATGGTIFLDEIGDMPLALQAKLLRILEDQKFERVGGNESVSVDVRTIYATGKNLKEEVKAGRFREDLYYRLNVLPIVLPSLRERKEDIPLLVEHFMEVFSKKTGKTGLAVSPTAVEMLMSYDYPGNVRELKHAVEMAVTFCRGNIIEPCCLPVEIREMEMGQHRSLICNNLPITEKVKAFERDLLARVLEETGGKKKETAKKLGISRGTLWRKLKDHGFPVSELDLED